MPGFLRVLTSGEYNSAWTAHSACHLVLTSSLNCPHLTPGGYVVVSVGYRKTGVAPFPVKPSTLQAI
jgi:hypothetical protein